MFLLYINKMPLVKKFAIILFADDMFLTLGDKNLSFLEHRVYDELSTRMDGFVKINCYYILFTKLPWPGDSKGTFRSSSQAATCPPVYHTGGGFTQSI